MTSENTKILIVLIIGIIIGFIIGYKMYEISKINSKKTFNKNVFKGGNNPFETTNVIAPGVQDKNGYMLYNGNCLMFNLYAFNQRCPCTEYRTMTDNPATVFHCPISIVPEYETSCEGSFGTDEYKWKVAGLDKYKLNSCVEVYPIIYYYYFKVNTNCTNPTAGQVYADLLCLQKVCEQILIDIITTKNRNLQIQTFDHKQLDILMLDRNITTKNTGDMFVALEGGKIFGLDRGQIASIIYKVDQEFRKICSNLPNDFTCILDEDHYGIYEYQNTRKLEGHAMMNLMKLDFTNIDNIESELPNMNYEERDEYGKYFRYQNYEYNGEFKRIVYDNSINNIDTCADNLYDRSSFKNNVVIYTYQGEMSMRHIFEQFISHLYNYCEKHKDNEDITIINLCEEFKNSNQVYLSSINIETLNYEIFLQDGKIIKRVCKNNKETNIFKHKWGKRYAKKIIIIKDRWGNHADTVFNTDIENPDIDTTLDHVQFINADWSKEHK